MLGLSNIFLGFFVTRPWPSLSAVIWHQVFHHVALYCMSMSHCYVVAWSKRLDGHSYLYSTVCLQPVPEWHKITLTYPTFEQILQIWQKPPEKALTTFSSCSSLVTLVLARLPSCSGVYFFIIVTWFGLVWFEVRCEKCPDLQWYYIRNHEWLLWVLWWIIT